MSLSIILFKTVWNLNKLSRSNGNTLSSIHYNNNSNNIFHPKVMLFSLHVKFAKITNRCYSLQWLCHDKCYDECVGKLWPGIMIKIIPRWVHREQNNFSTDVPCIIYWGPNTELFTSVCLTALKCIWCSTWWNGQVVPGSLDSHHS